MRTARKAWRRSLVHGGDCPGGTPAAVRRVLRSRPLEEPPMSLRLPRSLAACSLLLLAVSDALRAQQPAPVVVRPLPTGTTARLVRPTVAPASPDAAGVQQDPAAPSDPAAAAAAAKEAAAASARLLKFKQL